MSKQRAGADETGQRNAKARAKRPNRNRVGPRGLEVVSLLLLLGQVILIPGASASSGPNIEEVETNNATTLYEGDSFWSQAECEADPDGDDVYVTWFIEWNDVHTAQDKWGYSPDLRLYHDDFPGSGTWDVQLQCHDDQGNTGGDSHREFTINVHGNSGPEIDRTWLRGTTSLGPGDYVEVEVSCRFDPEGDDRFVLWFIDGVARHSARDPTGSDPEYRFDYDDLDPGGHTLTVQCEDEYGNTADSGHRESWSLQVEGTGSAPHMDDADYNGNSIEGGSGVFTVDVSDQDGDLDRVEWSTRDPGDSTWDDAGCSCSLSGSQDSATLNMGWNEPGTWDIRAEVFDRSGLHDRYQWQKDVAHAGDDPPAPSDGPSIQRRSPAASVDASPGDAVTFAVECIAGTEELDDVKWTGPDGYEDSDSVEDHGEERETIQMPSREGTFSVTAFCEDRAGKESSQIEWSVTVKREGTSDPTNGGGETGETEEVDFDVDLDHDVAFLADRYSKVSCTFTNDGRQSVSADFLLRIDGRMVLEETKTVAPGQSVGLETRGAALETTGSHRVLCNASDPDIGSDDDEILYAGDDWTVSDSPVQVYDDGRAYEAIKVKHLDHEYATFVIFRNGRLVTDSVVGDLAVTAFVQDNWGDRALHYDGLIDDMQGTLRAIHVGDAVADVAETTRDLFAYVGPTVPAVMSGNAAVIAVATDLAVSYVVESFVTDLSGELGRYIRSGQDWQSYLELHASTRVQQAYSEHGPAARAALQALDTHPSVENAQDFLAALEEFLVDANSGVAGIEAEHPTEGFMDEIASWMTTYGTDVGLTVAGVPSYGLSIHENTQGRWRSLDAMQTEAADTRAFFIGIDQGVRESSQAWYGQVAVDVPVNEIEWLEAEAPPELPPSEQPDLDPAGTKWMSTGAGFRWWWILAGVLGAAWVAGGTMTYRYVKKEEEDAAAGVFVALMLPLIVVWLVLSLAKDGVIHLVNRIRDG